MTYSYAWDESSPSGASDINLGDDRIREMKTTIRQALDDEHTSLTDAPSGSLMHAWKVTSKSTGSPYTALSSDHIILVTTGSSTDYAIYLPTAVGITGKPYKIKKVDSGTKAVVITPNGAETIDGEASLTLNFQNDFVDIISDGTNWIIVATNSNLSTVVQVVNTENGSFDSTTAVIPHDDSIPQITEGKEFMTLDITPRKATNILQIDVTFVGACSGILEYTVALFQDDTANALAAVINTNAYTNEVMTVTFRHTMVAGTVSPTTFRVRAGNGASTAYAVYFNGTYSGRLLGGVSASSITITELSA